MAEETHTQEKHRFEAETGKLLEIVANSLYSEREIFLRELISNASDACDRLRYAALTDPDLTAGDADLAVTISVDKKAGTLTLADNGIGMSHDDLVADLGTIARSGSAAFLGQLSGDASKDLALIGRFGVGFYSAFMVADEVIVRSRKAGESEGWEWRSDGKGEFTVAAADGDVARGVEITLKMRKDANEFLAAERLRHIVKTYSDHIALPIVLDAEGKEETVNTASALWTRPKKEITPEQYTEFYHHVGHMFDEPWLVIHNRVEGKLEYTNLLFVPSSKPFDLFDPARSPRLKLYVKRVFITDDCEDLLPGYLRFLRGIVDSEDMPLNVSREMLQNNPVVARIRSGLVKRVLGELKKKAGKEPEAYAKFWDDFGALLKEGIYEDSANRDRLLEIARFRTTAGDGLASLDDYVGRMKVGQEAIYYISGDTLDLDKIAADEKPEEEDKTDDDVAPSDIDNLVASFKLTLEGAVKDVRVSARLTDSPVCLVADTGDLDMHLERLLRQHQRIKESASRILEINPKHPLIRGLAKRVSKGGATDDLADAAHLLLDQARIIEGEPPPDAAAFAQRLAGVMQKGLAA
jgi:molecular chaperone HtpG